MRFGCIIVVFFITVFTIHGWDVSLSPLAVLTEEASLELTDEEKQFSELYYEAVKKADARNILRTQFLDLNRLPGGKEVKSVMDATDVCEMYKIDYLVFGYYRKSYKTVEAEIRIFDRERNEVRKTFFAKGERNEFKLVRDDLAGRFVEYMYGIVGIEVKRDIPRIFRGFGGFELTAGAGYWLPTGDWFSVYTGVVKADVGLLIHPEEELFWLGDFLFMYRFGISLEYRLGVSRPEVETSTLHSVKLMIPLQGCVLFLERHAAYLGIALYYQHDFINQFSLYGSPNWLNSGTLGGGLCLGYEYWIGENKEYSLGGTFTADIDFYEHVSVEPALTIKFTYRFPFNTAAAGEEKTE